ncbi:MAG: shikimate kinase [Candidatus Brocadiia bacterium]
MNIVLIGFRGVGKTSAGKLLAEQLGMEFIDADDIIESRAACPIGTFFLTKTDSAFRLVESDAINELSKLDAKIIATGGGAITKYKNVRNLKRHGLIILLEADLETIYKRIQMDDLVLKRRPGLTGQDLYNELKNLINVRAHYYHGAADMIVDTCDKPLRIVVDEIIHLLKQKGYLDE